jgi:hypothetical protein
MREFEAAFPKFGYKTQRTNLGDVSWCEALAQRGQNDSIIIWRRLPALPLFAESSFLRKGVCEYHSLQKKE